MSTASNLRLEHALRSRKPAFIPYLMAGDPDIASTEAIARGLAQVGAVALELGVPYGDPLADGPTIAAAGQRAIASGTRVRDVLALVHRLSDAIPVVLFTYFNPVCAYGLDLFAADAASAGAGGGMIPGFKREELGAGEPAVARRALAMPLLVAPTTPAQRATRIAQRATGFVYIVSRLGVTGAAAAPSVEPLRVQTTLLRAVTRTPLAVGFGISTRAHVDTIASLVDGFIVGSALIDAYAGTTGEEATARAQAFALELVRAS